MKVPSSTYRIQLHKDFTFKQLGEIIDYLQTLGISTVYAAPILRSRPGSMHGYDVVDPHTIDPEVGREAEFKSLSSTLKTKQMTWLQDIVPNHMAFDVKNKRLMDVLERGNFSPYYNYFDINWNHPDTELKGKVCVPFLGKTLQDCVKDKEVKVGFSGKGFTVDYYDTSYPLSVSAFQQITTNPDLRAVLKQYVDEAKKSTSLDEWLQYKKKWINDVKDNDALVKNVEAECARINNSEDCLQAVFQSQFYLLEFWKNSEKRINYRRFFTVNELICLRMEDKAVFDEYHQFLNGLYKDDYIQGVRIDHIDGLQDPTAYVNNLRQLLGKDCYIIAEKILEAKEDMPNYWPIEGTSGYEFLSYVSQLITDRQGGRKLVDFYSSLFPDLPPYNKLVYENKKLILENYMGGEWENLIQLFFELNLQGNLERERLKQGLAYLMLCLPVYRIYPDKLPLEGKELEVLEEAFAKARQASKEYNQELNHFHALITKPINDKTQEQNILRFTKRLMQFTGPLTAKGVEDTTFYVYNPLISHDEVGDAPSTLGISIQTYHAKMVNRQKSTPLSLNATATHDTKRGEDARLRLNILSELPEVWMKQVKEWMALNKELHENIDGVQAPSINDEYFIYQTIIGGFPEDFVVTEEFIKRVQEYLIKAVREAKVNSNWSAPNEAYENACLKFIETILSESHAFLKAFVPFEEVIVKYAHIYALCQTLIKITSPGIPDIYQGCELWDLSFVDPDNRRPVDYKKRISILNEIVEKEKEGAATLFPFLKSKRREGYEKLFVTWKSLNFRKQVNEVFTKGEYIPLEVGGKDAIVMAFARVYQGRWAIIAVPLALAKNSELEQPYADDLNEQRYIALPIGAPAEWKNVFTGESIKSDKKLTIFDVFKDFPVALLINI
ncbi:malto-oligosyltrehalose synthase [Chryseosolibacter indicus]|uniref:Malto-oligosyltrehalose synthase n=1 Tax=Chryseosolibacter indicus TaxID=2782351 RepID=A0ABS5VLB0_9BACT|nr:malto-oligosyltrehalose synthase [Chryseosolibacter indicus]MBT1701783.1 malto-oligosyltrehalose synthase [Chryseosolibacter indicus]